VQQRIIKEMYVRKVTNQLLSAIEDGVISAETVVRLCLDYMSEDQVLDLCESEGLMDLLEDDNDEQNYDEHDEGVLFDE
jgi:hypothetical protein